ncbi:hypothetical protein BCR36DRAFT_403896 [Piromyces finnis]|uniref:RING-type E3 ubiquitin transferase n=1 Tax=Piromyces finnis TaxID=1754191 RepID=A0A1Y1VBQ9_9FUNG|nr:hypothetical protein BCR36DRAFT_403896 [Piromyces finnis]|eukprot:ORX52129.1 hypothetical protein BCR36DRAFT_403896 [Piromyces finnis]
MNWKNIIYVLFFVYVFYQIIHSDYETISLVELRERLNNTIYTLNKLNFGDVRNFTEIQKDLNKFFERKIENPVYYHNVTGAFSGTWSNQTLLINDNYNKTEIDIERGSFDYKNGSILYNIFENETISEDINFVEGYVKIKNKKDYTMNVKGVHFISDGYIALYGIPLKDSFPLKEISLMMHSEFYFNNTVKVIQERLKQDIEELNNLIEKNPNAVEKFYNNTSSTSEDDYDDENPSNCKFNIFFKLKSVNTTDSELLEYEKELKKPTGIKPLLKTAPPLEGDSLLYSENCKLYLKLDNNAKGKKIENIILKYTYTTVGSIFTTLATIILYGIQQKHTPSQPSLSKISGISQIMVSFLNLIVITVNILMGTSVDGYNSTLYITAASFKGISFIFFERIYIMKVIDRYVNVNNSGNSNILLICYWLFAFVGQIFILTLLNGRLIAFYIIMFILYSYWIPQIIYNVKNNAEKPLSKIYLYGMSIVQLYVLVFIYNLDININIDQFNINFIYIIIAYTFLQVLILSLQNKYGPLFLIPEKFLPQRYNYHPILPIYNEKEEEEGEHVDANDTSVSSPLEGIYVNQECAICFTNIVENNKVNNKDYMVTPCHHIFHTECLKHWMNIKMECPVCRAELPQ